MNKTIITMVVALQCLMTGMAWSNHHPIGHVISLQGAASAEKADGQVISLAIQSVIHANDRIRTEAGSKVQIMLADEAITPFATSTGYCRVSSA